jgi:hypothetical protein
VDFRPFTFIAAKEEGFDGFSGMKEESPFISLPNGGKTT